MDSNDLTRFDRQNRTYGKDATIKLSTSSVLIIGHQGGLSTETCKNLLLSGVSELLLVDDGNIEKTDLVTGFYYTEEDIGKKRCDILSKKLQDLNPRCKLECISMEDVDYEKMSFNVVLVHNLEATHAINISNDCRKFNKKFVWVRSRGVSGVVFVDCLESHKVSDLTGEVIDPVQLESIDKNGIVACAANNVHEFQTNDYVCLSNLEGENIEFLKDIGYLQIEVINKTSFKFKEFPENKEFTLINGTATTKMCETEINHKPLSDEIIKPTVIGFNSDIDLQIIKLYEEVLEIPIDSWSKEVDEIIDGIESSDNKDVKKLVRSFNLPLTPVFSVLGSIAAMEVIKLLTNKFLPISQWIVYSDPSLIPDEKPDVIDGSGLGNLLGSDCKGEIEGTKWLMVGCGAIGCEMLKNLAKINFAENGLFCVTDPDHIETSNLSRQFLFRNEHIKSPKSVVAAKEISKMNPKMRMLPLTEKLSNENQDLFDDKLSKKLFGVINALDNVDARRYVDAQCFKLNVPLFESGTQGTKGNTQPVIPFVTKTYSDSVDPPDDKSYPVCTIKNFPNKPEHTIHWAMDYFENFKRAPENINKYKSDGAPFLENLSQYDKNLATEDIHKYCVKYKPKSWQDCAIWASDVFLELYRDQILQLLNNFPKESTTSDGKPFWSKGKRCPNEIDFDLSNELVVDFLVATTHLLCRNCNLEDNFTKEDLTKSLESYFPYKFEVDDRVKIASNDSELKDEKKTEVEYELPSELPEQVFSSQEFEKDDDSNYHVAFITAASNLRCFNYGIPISSFEETKGIAGKIIPAVATTTSIVAGLITIEIMKFCYQYKFGENIDGDSDFSKMLETYKSWYVNLANNILVSSEPEKAVILKFGDVEMNSWTKSVLTTDLTLEMLISLVEEKFKLDEESKVSMILYETSIIYANFMPSDTSKNLSTIFLEKFNIKLEEKSISLVITSENDEINLPTIEIKLEGDMELSV